MTSTLIIVDIQNGFVKNEEAIKLLNNIEELLKRNIFDKVIATKFSNHKRSQFNTLLKWNDLINKNEQKIPLNIEKYVGQGNPRLKHSGLKFE